MRICAQASIGELRRTPFGSIEIIDGKKDLWRGLRARAPETKTKARKWVCSSLAIDEEHDGWLRSALDMVAASHGTGAATDDHFGKRAKPDRSGWTSAPPDGPSDAAHIRC